MLKMTGELKLRWNSDMAVPEAEDFKRLGRMLHGLLMHRELPLSWEIDEDEITLYYDPQFCELLSKTHSYDIKNFVEDLANELKTDREWYAVGHFSTFDEDCFMARIEISVDYSVEVGSPNWLMTLPAKDMKKLQQEYTTALGANDAFRNN